MSAHRPKNLNLFTIHFPLPAIVSILHRLTGAVLFICVPFLIWLFAYSLTSDGFATLQDWFQMPLVKCITWILIAPLCFHLVAGIRHLLMDIHIGETLLMGRLSAITTFVIALVLMILVGIWLW